MMRRQRRGRIITIGSLAGLIGVPFQSYYAASKHALEGRMLPIYCTQKSVTYGLM
ncbi:SDR family NAD(P)-dependent oxidoreductase [Spirosoma foliorum]|uniref:SDR family NAD(P)-dependent oxidoreductase n=1 Tax=Spirosoma foliorum TaxID=2710596 RepID=A0A7G5H1I6_9BACT|nr:SDR family NAD(P)-dependent oxidoreductase [Spirosoma foliorum]QMW04978.1 SDR family NAD(P)-dependent oxidoreductase [Spirosoma foliorum]